MKIGRLSKEKALRVLNVSDWLFLAGITVFDLRKVLDKTSYAELHRYPEGMKYIIVNGKIAVDGNEHTGVLVGKALRRNRYLPYETAERSAYQFRGILPED